MWTISLAAWGPRYVALAKRLALPSIAHALRFSKHSHRIVIHTDNPKAFANKPYELNIACRKPAEVAGYARYYTAHQEIVRESKPGDLVSLLPCDAVMSREFFAAIERRLAQGFKAVASIGSRTLSTAPPPIGMSSAELLSWSVDHLHPMSCENVWGIGRTMLPSIVYFTDEQGVVLHSFNFGIVGFINDGRDLSFKGTHDLDFPARFAPAEVHIATDRDEFALAECSGAVKPFAVQDVPFDAQDVADWARHNSARSPWNLHSFAQPFVLRGIDSGQRLEPVKQILAMLARAKETKAQAKARSLRDLRRRIADNVRRGARYSQEQIVEAAGQIVRDIENDPLSYGG